MNSKTYSKFCRDVNALIDNVLWRNSVTKYNCLDMFERNKMYVLIHDLMVQFKASEDNEQIRAVGEPISYTVSSRIVTLLGINGDISFDESWYATPSESEKTEYFERMKSKEKMMKDKIYRSMSGHKELPRDKTKDKKDFIW